MGDISPLPPTGSCSMVLNLRALVVQVAAAVCPDVAELQL
jgi:hypothetical protein